MRLIDVLRSAWRLWIRLRPLPEGTRRSWRQREELRLRLRGEYGPEWWEALPGAAMIAVAVAVPLAGLSWLWTRFGWWAALLAAGLLVYAVRALVLRRRAAVVRARRRAVRHTLQEIDAADDRGFRRIVGRLLIRDGWTARGVQVNDSGTVHLVGVGPDGRRMGCAFERGITAAGEDGPRAAATLRPVSAAPDDDAQQGAVDDGRAPLLLVVSSGSFARERVLWAARARVRLVGRELVQRWGAGESLWELLDLARED
ncbi:hypothetical protein ACKI14_45100 [Streptomyces turgidiscabies]|uniref:hypothetical protein n=1 Tax=Streptomyces turgidiscabies TaxID=85558 RepID=UPI0038F61C27